MTSDSDNDMRICAITTGREIDIEREGGKGEQTTNNTNSIESSSLDNNAHVRIGLSKNISDKKGNVNIWIGVELKKAVIKARINISEFVRTKLLEELKNRNIKIEIPDPELIIMVRCPNCGFQQNTTTIRMVRCHKCNRYYRVYRKGGRPRIVKIVKGSEAMLHSLYYRYYR